MTHDPLTHCLLCQDGFNASYLPVLLLQQPTTFSRGCVPSSPSEVSLYGGPAAWNRLPGFIGKTSYQLGSLQTTTQNIFIL